jgi:hypothetical protein
MAAPAGRPRRPRGRRRRPRPAGALDRQLAAHPAPGWARGGSQHRPDRPGPVRWPLVETADALPSGQISPAHARVLAHGTRQLPDHVAADAEPVLVEAAARLDPPLLRQAVGYLVEVADPQGTDAAHQRRHERRGLWLAPTLDHMVAVNGLLDPEAGHTLQAALEPLARPADADDDRGADQRTADALAELGRHTPEGGGLPKAGGVRPQLLVAVDLNSLLGRPGRWVGT